ncbi:hypothetical protein H4219_005929, partial [Mycoemilia scoparia]
KISRMGTIVSLVTREEMDNFGYLRMVEVTPGVQAPINTVVYFCYLTMDASIQYVTSSIREKNGIVVTLDSEIAPTAEANPGKKIFFVYRKEPNTGRNGSETRINI